MCYNRRVARWHSYGNMQSKMLISNYQKYKSCRKGERYKCHARKYETEWAVKVKWSLRADCLVAARVYTGFSIKTAVGVFLLPLDGMLVQRRSLPRDLLDFLKFSGAHWVWELNVLPKTTKQCPRSGLEPGPLAPGTCALTMRPPRLQHKGRAKEKMFFSQIIWLQSFTSPL